MNFNNHLPAPKYVDISPYPEFESPIQKKIKYSPLASREGIETLANNEKEDIKAPTEHRFISQNEKINLNNNQTTRIDIKSMDHLISRRQSRVSSEKRKSLLITNMNDGPGEMIEIDIFKTFDYPQNNCKQTMETFLTSLFFQILINVFTVWCLFADDFKIIFVPKVPGDTVFDIINSICLLVFIFEIILASITRKQYILSFYFFMDFVSTGIIIFDLTWVQEAMMKGNTDVSQSFPLASLKIMRIVRLIRLIRFMKLYKALQEKKRKKHFEKVLNINRLIRESVAILKIEHRKTLFSNIDNELEMEREKSEKLKEEREKLLLKETRIGKKILEKTVKRTIFLVLILVFCGPLFSSSFFYNKDNKGYLANLHILANLSENQVDSSSILRLYQLYTLNQSTTDFPLIYCNLPSINATYETVNLNDLREEEKMTKILYVTPYTAGFQATIDIRKFTMLNSIMNILTTIYIALVLLVTCYMFQKDLHQYVIDPLTRMTLKINKIANNPLASKENYNFEKKVAIYETQQIEESIEKIGILLALGFGEAGSFIISQNISSEGDLVATLPGSKTFGIFGFCDIRNFTDTTEILQEEVMVFVNNIADVVHSLVNRYGGSANKNIGDAFLLVWKFPKTEIEDDQGELKLKKTRTVKNITDLALIAFLKIICAINQEPKFLKYRSHPKLNERIHNYQIKMGFGLHIGWAIEGSIGSEFKIDASYLSPNVNMAARLEAATKQYRSLLLISNGFVEYASKGTKRYCREIDRVTVKGSNEPIGIFTVDLDLKDLENSNMTSGIENRKLSSLDRKFFKERALNIFEKMHKYLECDKQLSLTLKGCKGEFKNLFEKGFEKYIGGQWREAKTIFEKGLEMRKEDGPSAVLLGVMDDHQFVAPDNWMGYRALTEK